LAARRAASVVLVASRLTLLLDRVIDMCDEDDGEYCVGVGLQIFLTLQVGTSVVCFYVGPLSSSTNCAQLFVLPTWLGWTVPGFIHAFCFGVIVSMMFANYLKAWMGDPGGVPSDFAPTAPETEQPSNDGDQLIQATTCRFCKKCDKHKPPRAHHCRICKRCVLRMDHHCPWVQNCVGARNLKFFVLFLFYAACSCFYYAGTAALMIFAQFSNETVSRPSGGAFVVILITVVVSGCLGLMVVGLLLWNLWLIAKNQTTIENFEFEIATSRSAREGVVRMLCYLAAFTIPQKHRHPWDLGTYRNFQQVFGASMARWFLPVYGGDDGLSYRTYQQMEGQDIEMV